MSNLLGGKQGTAYLGTNARQPPDYNFATTNPTSTNINWSIGDLWLNTQSQILWVLVSLAGNSTSAGAKATWQQLSFGGGGGTLTGLQDEFGTITNPTAGIIQFPAGTNTNTLSLGGNQFSVNLNNFIVWPATDLLGDGTISLGGIIFFSGYGTRNAFFGGAGNLFLTTGSATDNVGVGFDALHSLTTGVGSVAVGSGALEDATTGTNIGIGFDAGTSITTGTDNILIGYNAGGDYISTESSNIILGNNLGVAAESNVLRIGVDGSGAGDQNAAYIAGIYNRSIGATSGVVQIDNTFKLGSSNGTNGEVLIGGGTGPVWATLTPGTGIAITNGANSITISSESSPAVNCAFLYQFTPNQTNQTGDATVVTIGATQTLTQIFDVGSNTTTAGVFTAPATAKYYLELTIDLTAVTANTGASGVAQIVTTAQTYIWDFNPDNISNAAGEATISFGQLVDMSNGDTAHFTVSSTGASPAKTVGIGAKTFIAGFLVSGAGVGTVTLTGNTGTATESVGNINVLGVNNITTTASGSTLDISVTGTTNHALQLGNASGSLTSLAVATNGQLPIGSTGANPVLATITGGTGITVTNGAGSISIAATGGGGGGTTWNAVSGTTQAMAVNNGYYCQNAGLTTLTLPSVAAAGTILEISGTATNTGGWTIAQNAGQNIYFLTANTTTGVSGSLSSSEANDACKLLCVVANTSWNVITAVGNLTVV